MGLDRDALQISGTVARTKDLKPHEKLILEYARESLDGRKDPKRHLKDQQNIAETKLRHGELIEARQSGFGLCTHRRVRKTDFEKPKKTAQRFQKDCGGCRRADCGDD